MYRGLVFAVLKNSPVFTSSKILLRIILNQYFILKVAVTPQGNVHYQQNLSCRKAKYISAFNNEDPGVLTITNRLFTLPTESLSVSFNLDELQIQNIAVGLPSNVAGGRRECLKRCNIKNY